MSFTIAAVKEELIKGPLLSGERPCVALLSGLTWGSKEDGGSGGGAVGLVLAGSDRDWLQRSLREASPGSSVDLNKSTLCPVTFLRRQAQRVSQ